jgi:hypothetical protein
MFMCLLHSCQLEECSPMRQTHLIAIPCRISQGVVPDERAFEVSLSGGTSHSGVAPVYYFWNQEGERLGVNEPLGDQEMRGRIAARLLDRQNGTALVSIPDGAVVQVQADSISSRPSEVIIDVPVGS